MLGGESVSAGQPIPRDFGEPCELFEAGEHSGLGAAATAAVS